MKTKIHFRLPFICASVCSLMLAACQFRGGYVKADGSSGYHALNLGIREKEVTQSAESYAAAEQSGEASFREARLVAQTAIVAGAAVDLASAGVNAYKAAQATRQAGIRADAAVSQSAAAAEVEKLRILHPSE